MLKKHHVFLILIGISNIILINYLLQLFSQTNICNDSLNYIEAAQFLYGKFETHQYRPIFFSFIVGIPFLFSDSIDTILLFSVIVNAICWMGTSILVFEFLESLISKKYAFLIATTFLFLIGNLALIFQLLTESIFTFFVVLAFYFYLKYRQENNFKFLAYFIALFILSMLIKPSSLFFGLFLMFYFGKQLLKNYKSKYGILILLSIFFVGIQCFGNYKKYGDFKISYIDSVTYYNYLGTKAVYLKNNENLKDFGTNYRNEYIFSLSPKEANIVAKQDFITQLTSNFDNLIKAYFYDLRYNSTGGSSTIKLAENVKESSIFNVFQSFLFGVSKIQNVFFTLVGLVLSFYFLVQHRKQKKEMELISVFVIYTIFLSGVSMAQGDRFHVVVFPLVLILIGIIIQNLFSSFKNENKNYL